MDDVGRPHRRLWVAALAASLGFAMACGDDASTGAGMDAGPADSGSMGGSDGGSVDGASGLDGSSTMDSGSSLDAGELPDEAGTEDATVTDDAGTDGGEPAVFVPVVAAGWHHACATRADGTVACWGDNRSGQLGDGTMVDRTAPVAVAGLTGVVELEAGGFHTCARTSAGEVYCWGEGSRGQLGDRSSVDRATPVAVSGADRLGVAQVSAGGGDYPVVEDYERTGVTCLLTSSGEVRCTGANNFSQLGDGRYMDQDSPVRVTVLAGSVLEIAAGITHVCALMADRTVWCWGDSTYGQDLRVSVPAGEAWMIPDLSGVSSIAATGAQTCAAQPGGVARCWGGDIRFPPSRMIVESSPTPFSVPSIEGLGVGAAHACAALSTGEVRCWGDNEFGQLAEDAVTVTGRDEPGPVVLDSVVSIVGGLAFNVAVRSDGSVVTWGENTHGQLGDGTTTHSSTPTPVSF